MYHFEMNRTTQHVQASKMFCEGVDFSSKPLSRWDDHETAARALLLYKIGADVEMTRE